MAEDDRTKQPGAQSGGPADSSRPQGGRPQGERSQFEAQSAFDVVSTYLHPGRENVMLIYVLYLAGLVPAFGAVPIIVGFIMALLNRSSATGAWASHYEYQYRQAAMGLLFVIVSFVLIFVVIGVVGFILTAIWWIVRSVKGLQAASREQAIADPKSYSW